MEIKELVTYMVKAMVDNPEAVEVSEVESENTSIIELKVRKDDLGKVIGKEGRNAQALRTIMSAASAKKHRRAVLEIVE